MKKAEKSYITKVKLKGYKSIRDVEIDFSPDMNIIIGKNGSGKTNFLNFLYMASLRSFEDVDNDFSSDVEIFYNNEYNQIFSKLNKEHKNINDELNTDVIDDYYLERKILNKDKKLIKTIKGLDNLKKERGKAILRMIRHGIPYGHLYMFEMPFNFIISNNVSSEINKIMRSYNSPGFIKNLFFVFRKKYYSTYDKNVSENKIKTDIDLVFNQSTRNNLLHNLTKFTDIQDIRLNKSFSVNKSTAHIFNIRNLEFEFLVNGGWFPFSSLSDGLKRIFLIIAEVSLDKIDDFELGNKIIFIEEPELGIHPHQLFQLMTFLKEESYNKQIIISSHAPEVLDFLDKNELNKIIICKYEKEKGTILKHLTNKEIKNAQHYIEDNILYLSDYWKRSDLENF